MRTGRWHLPGHCEGKSVGEFHGKTAWLASDRTDRSGITCAQEWRASEARKIHLVENVPDMVRYKEPKNG